MPNRRNKVTKNGNGPQGLFVGTPVDSQNSRKIVGSSGHEKAPTRGNPGLERPGRPRGSKDHAASTCGPHSDSFNDTSRRRRSNCSTNNFQTPCRSKS
ncbi:hypothetical protein TNCV_2985781 [Trichonephila clavipes]|nr:hypothetical protein TNCV_2985781 [Trichonephila clavipes]